MKKTIAKIMMVSAACLALTAMTAKTTQAQNGRFSVGAELGLPMGTFGDGYGLGIGGSLRYEYPIGDNMGIGLTAGYITFSGKTVSGYKGPSFSMIPAQAFFKYYFQEQQKGFYGMVDLGIHHSSVKIAAITYVDPFTGQTVELYPAQTVSATDLSYAPEIGYHLDNIDLGLRYQIVSSTGSTTSYLGVRIAYVFGSAK